MTGPEAADRAMISYRQLDWWTRQGYLNPADATPGSGVARDYDYTEADVALIMGLLVRHGIKPAAAAGVARSLRTDGIAHLGLFALTYRTKAAAS